MLFKNELDLRLAIEKQGLEDCEDKLLSLLKPAARILPVPVDNDQIPIGASKLGGDPDLPEGYTWRYHNENPLTFIGQFRLSELAPFDVGGLLPAQGMLYFFYEAYAMTSERGVWEIVYVEDESIPLTRYIHPTQQCNYGIVESLPAHQVSFEDNVALPDLFVNREGRLFDDEYFDALANLSTSKLPKHFFFGHPYIIQDDVLKYCVQDSMGIEFTPANKGQWKTQNELIKSLMPSWQFLFQIDSDDSLEILWGDMGTLYVCIPRDSLQKRQFEDCWVVMQYY